MKEYVTLKTVDLSSLGERFSALKAILPGLCGAEVYLADITPREKLLYSGNDEMKEMMVMLKNASVRRLHASYWASPSSFLCGKNTQELYSHFGSSDLAKEYYTDLHGKHLYDRWFQEYIMAKLIGADAYVFHLIDYFPIDGVWRFTLTPKEVVECMVTILSRFIKELTDFGLMDEESPLIELENAGWGLEYGIQTWEDYEYLFSKINDPFGKMRISWDINHLLHAIGEKDGKGRFFLPEDELTPQMKIIEERYGDDPKEFAIMWIRHNVLNEKTADKVSTIQLSDCMMKKDEIFTQGFMNPPYRDILENLSSWEEKESYGERVVLENYDSHLPLGKGILKGSDMSRIISELEERYGQINVLHELKNSTDLEADLLYQTKQLYGE